KYSFVVSLDCLNGNFALPDEGTPADSDGDGVDDTTIPVSLAEAFLMANEKGAVAVWAASALGYTSDHEVLGPRLFGKIFGEENQWVLGDAVMGAMTGSITGSSSDGILFPMDVFSTFVFFGDPATRLAIP
ncbi:MAG: hypothetical protein HY760_04425, partial [Nitrospirae bacterium]|nr:hypothetical protein [Nitrospirota bacterium]